MAQTCKQRFASVHRLSVRHLALMGIFVLIVLGFLNEIRQVEAASSSHSYVVEYDTLTTDNETGSSHSYVVDSAALTSISLDSSSHSYSVDNVILFAHEEEGGSGGGGVVPGDPDIDEDGLTGTEEDNLGTDPENPDTDGDGVSDGEEYANGTNPLSADNGSSSGSSGGSSSSTSDGSSSDSDEGSSHADSAEGAEATEATDVEDDSLSDSDELTSEVLETESSLEVESDSTSDSTLEVETEDSVHTDEEFSESVDTGEELMPTEDLVSEDVHSESVSSTSSELVIDGENLESGSVGGDLLVEEGSVSEVDPSADFSYSDQNLEYGYSVSTRLHCDVVTQDFSPLYVAQLDYGDMNVSLDVRLDGYLIDQVRGLSLDEGQVTHVFDPFDDFGVYHYQLYWEWSGELIDERVFCIEDTFEDYVHDIHVENQSSNYFVQDSKDIHDLGSSLVIEDYFISGSTESDSLISVYIDGMRIDHQTPQQ